MPSIQVVITKNPQRLSDRFIQAVGAQLDGVFNPGKINARNAACLQGHISRLSYSVVYSPLSNGQSAMFFKAPY